MDWKKQSETFNLIADIYDKYRPSYPKELIEEIINEAQLKKGSSIVEIGAGSGKATELLAGNGYEILCIEPGENLASIGRKRFSNEAITFITARFEDCEISPNRYDLVFAAQSFHWVPQPVGYEKSAMVLKENGRLALLWNMYIIRDNSLDKELLILSNRYGGFADFLTESQCNERISSIVSSIENSGCFGKVKVVIKTWIKKYTAEDYFGFVLTGNKFANKSDEEKAILRKEIIDLADKFGGFIERPYLCVLYIAKKINQ